MRVAIVGATGAVGAELLAVMEQRDLPVSELRLLASARSAGRTLRWRGEAHEVREIAPSAFEGIDVALFSAGGGVSREFAPAAVERGAVVVDNSSAFRMDPAVPLVVPECNADAIAGHDGIIANPNCSTIIMVLALAPIHRAVGLGRVIAATYQAASGAGQRAMEELRAGTRAALAGESFTPEALPHDLAFNVFPHVDTFQPDGYTREEDKMLFETRKILGVPDLAVEATCVRVPVERCHSMSLTVETAQPMTPDRARELLAAAAGVSVADCPEDGVFPQPRALAGTDPVVVGRVRESRVFPSGLTMWVVGDQLRKGAALNAVQIVENL